MIEDHRSLKIESDAKRVFSLIETMPNKFPVYRILESKPFLCLRALFTDGLRGAVRAFKYSYRGEEMILNIGDTLGPFTLTEVEKPYKYWFILNSRYFNCRTGYTLEEKGNATMLSMDIVADNPSLREKIYWYLIKPFHAILANKVLRVIKKEMEEIR